MVMKVLTDTLSFWRPGITLFYILGKFPKKILRTAVVSCGWFNQRKKSKYTQKEGMIKETEHSRKFLKYSTHALPWQPTGLQLSTVRSETSWVDSPAPGPCSKGSTLAFCFSPALTGFDPFFSVDQCAKGFTSNASLGLHENDPLISEK